MPKNALRAVLLALMHEAGHALVAFLLIPPDDLPWVDIRPDAGALATHFPAVCRLDPLQHALILAAGVAAECMYSDEEHVAALVSGGEEDMRAFVAVHEASFTQRPELASAFWAAALQDACALLEHHEDALRALFEILVSAWRESQAAGVGFQVRLARPPGLPEVRLGEQVAALRSPERTAAA